MVQKTKDVIGATAHIDIVGIVEGVPAKIDTGADSSAIWASNVFVDPEGTLHYVLFGEQSPYYTGEVYSTKKFSVAGVVSSSGHRQIRYRIKLSARIGGRRILTSFNLSDRATHTFPVLVGKATLRGKFLVDVSKNPIKIKPNRKRRLNEELQNDPHTFFKKYHQANVTQVKE